MFAIRDFPDRHLRIPTGWQPFALVALYVLVWALLHDTAQYYWFLPAAFRLAMLAALPYRAWPLLYLGELIGIARHQWLRDALPDTPELVASTFLPWLTYAGAVVIARTWSRPERSPEGFVARLLAAALVAALLNGLMLAWAEGHYVGGEAVPFLRRALSFLLGDFAGCVLVAPFLLAVMLPNGAGWRRDPASVRMTAIAASVAILALIALGIDENVLGYATLAVVSVLVWIATTLGWRNVAMVLAICGVSGQLVPSVIDGFPLPLPLFQASIAVIGANCLLLGAATDSRRQHLENLRESNEALDRQRGELQSLAGRLVDEQERERRRLARELHDSLGQELHALSLTLASVDYEVNGESGVRANQLQPIERAMARVRESLASAIHSLHALEVERFGLPAALSEGSLAEMLKASGIDYRLEIDELPPLSREISTALFRICQEAASNAVKHGRASMFGLTLRFLPEQTSSPAIELRVSDDADALSFSNASGGTGLGLRSIADRTLALGGSHEFSRQAGFPRHRVLIPLPAASANFA